MMYLKRCDFCSSSSPPRNTRGLLVLQHCTSNAAPLPVLHSVTQSGQLRVEVQKRGVSGMDPIYMCGLRDAKTLLDESVLSVMEYTLKKEELLWQRNVRTVLAAREGESVEDMTKAHVADGAAVTHSSETGGDNDNDNEVELSAYLSRSSPFLA